jgi:hypothetical protein
VSTTKAIESGIIERLPTDVQLGGIAVRTPNEVVSQATTIAKQLKLLIKQLKLYTIIRDRAHVHCEGWTTCAAMLGVTPREVSCDEQADGSFVAVVELVRVMDGIVVGRGSGMCGIDESEWRKKPRYARRSMAVTRATGRACRLSFSWIIKLAGYEETPAEEIIHTAAEGYSAAAEGRSAALVERLIDADGERSADSIAAAPKSTSTAAEEPTKKRGRGRPRKKPEPKPEPEPSADDYTNVYAGKLKVIVPQVKDDKPWWKILPTGINESIWTDDRDLARIVGTCCNDQTPVQLKWKTTGTGPDTLNELRFIQRLDLDPEPEGAE